MLEVWNLIDETSWNEYRWVVIVGLSCLFAILSHTSSRLCHLSFQLQHHYRLSPLIVIRSPKWLAIITMTHNHWDHVWDESQSLYQRWLNLTTPSQQWLTIASVTHHHTWIPFDSISRSWCMKWSWKSIHPRTADHWSTGMWGSFQPGRHYPSGLELPCRIRSQSVDPGTKQLDAKYKHSTLLLLLFSISFSNSIQFEIALNYRYKVSNTLYISIFF